MGDLLAHEIKGQRNPQHNMITCGSFDSFAACDVRECSNGAEPHIRHGFREVQTIAGEYCQKL